MTKIDNSYLEKLGEVLYDDNKAVNYKVVSIMFGVHVNIAKQMLYHFYKTEKAKGKNIYATYYVSGMLPRKMLSKIGDKDGEGSEESPSQEISDELESYLVLICKDEKLEEMKTHFTKIFSVHVYSLSAFPLENYDALENLSSQRLSDEEGRTPVDFGPIICSASKKLIENHVVSRAPTVKKTEPVSRNKTAQESKPQTSSNEKSSKVEKTEKKPETDPKTQRPKVKPPQGIDKNRIKNMFATAATKPKPEKKAEPEIKAQSNAKSYKELKSANKRNRESDSRKRKRVQDIFSSSSEESDAEKDSDVEECLPESPIPSKKRSNQIMSDSEEEHEDDSEKVTLDSESEVLPESPTVNSKSNSSSKNVPSGKGRRRVLKTVTKNFVDGDGYLVTKREQVLVSEDEEETAPAIDEKEKEEDPVKSPPLKKAKDETKLSTQNSVKTLNNLKSKSSAAPAKTKQASLMSFFKKK